MEGGGAGQGKMVGGKTASESERRKLIKTKSSHMIFFLNKKGTFKLATTNKTYVQFKYSHFQMLKGN